MLYKESFKKFAKNGVDHYYVGTGNPNAPILIVGKESHISPDDEKGMNDYKSNAEKWVKRIEENVPDRYEYPVCEKHDLRKGWGKNTWSKYQQLSDIICNVTSEKFYVNFLHNVFTTEINDSPSRNSVTANKDSLILRKELFKKEDFIKQFPIVVLACSNYIKNEPNNFEINDIFDVQYDGDKNGKHLYSRGNWFYTHHDNSDKKLVIHTRQLSSNVDNKMLEDMGIIIREHLKKLSLSCYVAKS
jgi:hypothetical protein